MVANVGLFTSVEILAHAVKILFLYLAFQVKLFKEVASDTFRLNKVKAPTVT